MKLERITDTGHPVYGRAMELYQLSFPFHEQRERLSQERILQDSEYHFSLIYDGSSFAGLVLYWETDEFIYIEHLCILPEMRNRQYGQKTLSLLREKNKLLLLEIDPPEDEISRRRKGFYERCGFLENQFAHIHPPYHRENQGHRLTIMTCPRAASEKEYGRFYQYLERRVMNEAY